MKITDLTPAVGSKKKAKRVGRGTGSGWGKTSGRGQKGQHSRTQVRPGFEGGQTPLTRRLPKRRGNSKGSMAVGPFKKHFAVVNLSQLESFEASAEIDGQLLLDRRVLKQLGDGLRVLGQGELTKPLVVRAKHFSASAKAKIEQAGGQAVEV